MSVQMELHKIIISEMQDQQIIMLKEVDGERTFPIVIGSPEAMAISRRLKGEPTARPMTHDLLASRSWVMGRAVGSPLSRRLMAIASGEPITIGKVRSPSTSLSMMIC